MPEGTGQVPVCNCPSLGRSALANGRERRRAVPASMTGSLALASAARLFRAIFAFSSPINCFQITDICRNNVTNEKNK